VSAYEVLGALSGIAAVALTVRENVWCWPIGIVNVALYVIVFFQAKLYADMGLQLVYVALCLYGWHAWLHGGRDHGVLQVSRIPGRAAAALTVAGIAGSALLGHLLRSRTDAALPFWDSATTSFSLVAQAMQTKKWIENWIVWIAVDLVYVGIYLVKQLYLTAGLYAVFLSLALRGLVEWRRSMAQAVESQHAPV
jgi:nicotinamide mononucleotide transporter